MPLLAWQDPRIVRMHVFGLFGAWCQPDDAGCREATAGNQGNTSIIDDLSPELFDQNASRFRHDFASARLLIKVCVTQSVNPQIGEFLPGATPFMNLWIKSVHPIPMVVLFYRLRIFGATRESHFQSGSARGSHFFTERCE